MVLAMFGSLRWVVRDSCRTFPFLDEIQGHVMKCFGCDKELDNWDYERNGRQSYHPMGGLHLMSYGHYGSAVFDPMDGSTLNIAVCDECLRKHEDRITIMEPTDEIKAAREQHRQEQQELLEVFLDEIESISTSTGGEEEADCKATLDAVQLQSSGTDSRT